MSEGRWEFFTRIAEGCDTMRRHSADFSKAHLRETGEAVAASLLAYHLRQSENLAKGLAGERPAQDSPVNPPAADQGAGGLE